MIFEIIEIIFWFSTIFFLFLMAIIFFLEFRNRIGFSHYFFRGLFIFALTFGIARLIENIRRYFIGSYNDIFEAWIRGEQITGLNFWLRFFYYLISWVGMSFVYYNVERHIFTNNKFLLTILSIVEGVVSIINYVIFNMVTYWMAVWIYFIPAFFLSLLFFRAATKAPSKYVKNGCLLTALGIFTIATAVAIDLPETAYFWYIFRVETPELFVRLIAPILLTIGAFLLTFGLKYHFQESKGEKSASKSSEINVKSDLIERKLIDLANAKDK